MSDDIDTPIQDIPVDGPLGAGEGLAEASLEDLLRQSIFGSVEGVGETPVGLRVWELDLSPGTKHRLAKKHKIKGISKRPEHHATRKRKRREKYWRCQREGKLRRDAWLKTTPEGLWMYYKRLTTRKGHEWNVDRDSFLEVMYTPVRGECIYKYLFNIYRIDKSLGYSLDNIIIVDRYTEEQLYPLPSTGAAAAAGPLGVEGPDAAPSLPSKHEGDVSVAIRPRDAL